MQGALMSRDGKMEERSSGGMNRTGLWWAAVACALCFQLAVPGCGVCEIYRWVNEDGSVGFTDDAGKIPEKYRLGGAQQGSAVGGERTAAGKGSAAAPANEHIRGFSLAQTRIIAAAMREWETRYTCGREVAVESFNPKHRNLGNGRVESIEETATPGYMKINPASRIPLRTIVLHAMTHTCQPDEPTILPQPIPVGGGLVILGYHGASIKVRFRNGDESFFRLLEEGICERNASYFPGYASSHPSYFAAGKLAREHFPEEKDPMELIRRNDVPGLVAIIMGKKEPSLVDVRKVMEMYQEAWTGKK